MLFESRLKSITRENAFGHLYLGDLYLDDLVVTMVIVSERKSLLSTDSYLPDNLLGASFRSDRAKIQLKYASSEVVTAPPALVPRSL